ncbi:response regulator [Paraherbaspirillum soli]|uniref:Response regulator n=1 Tax=Paraherbaspirillum soli TaxID=631222 RepID=A0ABW0M8J4_9BURK
MNGLMPGPVHDQFCNLQREINLKIVLADDHPLILAGVSTYIHRLPGCRVVATAASSDELINCLELIPCDLVITEFSMPMARIGDGLYLLSYIKRHYPKKWVIVLTMNEIPAVLYQISHSGVNGLLHKSDETPEIGKAIQSVSCKKPYMGSALRMLLQHGHDARIPTPRETEVLRLYAAGHNLDEISARLSRSKKTISLQKAAVMKKLGLRNDIALGRYCAAVSGDTNAQPESADWPFPRCLATLHTPWIRGAGGRMR